MNTPPDMRPKMVHSLTNAISSLPLSSSRIPYSLPTGSIIWKSCAKAEEWYANGLDEYYDDPTDRRNSLNKFVSYHLLPMELSYNQLTTSQDYIKTNFVSWDAIDIEDWYETMMPHSVMRISYPKSGDRFINRKGAPKAARGIEFKGVRIWSPAERTDFDQTALNGQYHLLDNTALHRRSPSE